MENHELTWEIRNYVDVNRKPFNLKEITTKTKLTSLPSKVRTALDTLPVIDGDELFEFENEGFFADVLDGNQQIYLMKLNGRTFFIDTQGYSYARYVGEIV